MKLLSACARVFAVASVVGLAASVVGAQNVVVAQPGGGGARMMGGGPGGGLFGGMGGGNDLDPRLNSEALARYSKTLALSADQSDAAKALHESYLAAHQAKAEAWREAMEKARDEFRDSRDPSVFQDLAPKRQEFSEGVNKAEKAFMDDLKSLLDDKQAANWPTVERAQRREVSMKRGLMSGERPDLVKLVDKLDLPAEAKAPILPVLETYEQDLDRELVKRDEFSDKARDQMAANGGGMRNFGNPEGMAQIDEMIKQGREYAVKVRDVNRRYARQIESMLPEAAGAQFNVAFRKESFPDIYRDRHGQRVVEAALKMDDVSADVKGSLDAVREQYVRDSAALNAKAEQVIEQQEENFSISNMMARMGGGAGGDPAQRELREQREAIETATIKKVKDLLTPEQQAKLPERRAEERERERGAPGGPGGGGGNRQNRGNRNNQAPQGGL
ncbi:MAG: hypothetical protein ACKVS8_05760 [Phycisphaerales bacterium]